MFMEKKTNYQETLNSRIEFGNRVRQLRKAGGMTQDMLAEKIEISPRNLSDIENGKVNPYYSTIYSIAKAIGITMSELLNLEE